ncbi:HlyD family secretion protein [Caulobacter hibisci]|uniref:HlyD family secretion protein n=1 Tax=Caulobacter hibisci TaxID=2035993 RepID=A0ABS0SVX8_9CAUL|nr:HlyD family secretion protein [Caulobacter hibisci]MBI1683795.1 HlyD family secretion protein [Caulobacter hibisci]
MAAEDQTSQNNAAQDAAKTRRIKRGLLGVVSVAAVIGAVFGVQWWLHGRFVEETNDAYLRADQVTVSPKVSGYVKAVYVADNQAVVAGQPLLKIDAVNYEASLAAQAATIEARQADLETARRQIEQQQPAVTQAEAQLKGAQDAAAFAGREAERYRLLSEQGAETAQRYAQALNDRDQARAKLSAALASQEQARRQTATLSAQADQARAQLKSAQAQARSAQINVDDTVLRAAIAGRVGDRSVRLGQFVQPGGRLMSIVPVSQTYLVANFKETQIGRMRVGQHAKVKLDAFSSREIDAVIDSFAPGTGAQFALLPAENATGNFTKIVQRVPVRFRVLAPADLRERLLPGLSASISIDTSKAPGR